MHVPATGQSEPNAHGGFAVAPDAGATPPPELPAPSMGIAYPSGHVDTCMSTIFPSVTPAAEAAALA